jgi:drug/metabolite transporter (DMT)-like permease
MANRETGQTGVFSGRLLILAAAVLWSSGGFFAKAPLFADWPAEDRGPLLAFWRALWATVVLFPFVRRPTWSWKLVPMMLLFAAMNWSYLTAMSVGEAANAIWLQMTAPVWVFLFNAFCLRETIRRLDWLLLVFGAAGVGLILFCELQGERPAAVVYGLLSGIFYAGVVLSLRHLRSHDSTWLVALNHLFTAIVFAPAVITHLEYWPHGRQWLYLGGFGALQMGLPYVLFARGLKSVPSHEASGMGLLEPVFLPVWVYLAWGHSPDYMPPRWWTLVGGGLILTGLLVRFAGEVAAGRATKSASGMQ